MELVLLSCLSKQSVGNRSNFSLSLPLSFLIYILCDYTFPPSPLNLDGRHNVPFRLILRCSIIPEHHLWNAK